MKTKNKGRKTKRKNVNEMYLKCKKNKFRHYVCYKNKLSGTYSYSQSYKIQKNHTRRISREKKKRDLKEIKTQKINPSIYDYCSLDFKHIHFMELKCIAPVSVNTAHCTQTHIYTHFVVTACKLHWFANI